MENATENIIEIATRLVRQYFYIDDSTAGTQKDTFLVRYHGHLVTPDSEKAYDQLSASLKPYEITPLFRLENKQQVIYLISGVIQPNRSKPIVNMILFIVTFISVLLTGGLNSFTGDLPTDPILIIWTLIKAGWPFAVSMIAILAAHEFGHYFAGRFHGTQVTLPYFIPLPLSAFGTMGAFINMKEPPKNRNVLLDIGIAGPLSGLIVAIPVLFIGLKLSSLSVLPAAASPDTLVQLEGNSILYLFMKYLVFGKFLPEPASFGNLPALLYWIRYFFTGTPIPFGGIDVSLHQVAWAGWGGLLVTALNLIPAGQLDGGHILYVLFGKKAQKVVPFIIGAMILLGFFWNGWWLWVLIILFVGRTHAEPLDQITPLDKRRKFLAVLTLIIFVLIFTPTPINLMV